MTTPTTPPRTFVYIDGFNLYYGIRRTPYRWLNVAEVCRLLLPGHNIQSIKYFTAKVQSRPNDPLQHARQRNYIRALETLPGFSVIYGHFLSHPVSMTEYPVSVPPKRVFVLKTEEKGSDVNLAAHLLNDAHLGHFDVGVVISNDSDLVMPIQMARGLGKQVGVLVPPTKTPSQMLVRNTDFFKPIRPGVLQASQFPPTVIAKNGTPLQKPPNW
jgi:uncharacterized LabA/DUF88 family protein